MRRLKLAVRIFCVIPFVTGAFDLVDGIRLLKTAGVPLGEEIAEDPVLNSQVRFWGAIWFGYGIVLWRTSSDLRGEAGLFKVLCGILALSGLGRLASTIQYGSPGTPLTIAMLIELIGAPVFLGWHASLVRRVDSGDDQIETAL